MSVPFTALEQRTLQIAKSLVGKREATGRNDGWIARLTQRAVDPVLAWLEGQPWCVCFVVYCVHTAADQLGLRAKLPRYASSSLLYAWYRERGLLMKSPLPGCVGMVRVGRATGSDGSTRGKSHTHTFLVHEVRGGMVIGVDGNLGNAVGWSRRPAADCDFGPIC